MPEIEPMVEFGNGYITVAKHQFAPKQNEKGVMVIPFKLWINSDLKNDYKLKHIAEDTTLIREYPMSKVISLSKKATMPTIFITCGFNGETTEFEERFHKDLLDLIDRKDRMIQSKNEEIFGYLTELGLINGDPKKQAADLSRFNRALGLKQKSENTPTENPNV